MSVHSIITLNRNVWFTFNWYPTTTSRSYI